MGRGGWPKRDSFGPGLCAASTPKGYLQLPAMGHACAQERGTPRYSISDSGASLAPRRRYESDM
jgi:hypothetical protein